MNTGYMSAQGRRAALGKTVLLSLRSCAFLWLPQNFQLFVDSLFHSFCRPT